MSSKFPALEEIDDELAHSGPSGSGEFADFSNDGGDDFLSREKAALGAGAAEFQTSEDATVGSATQPDEISGFNASFPALETSNNSNAFSSGLISEPAEPYLPSQPDLSKGVNQLSLEDSEAVREWRERQALEIQRRDELSDAKRKETREKAKTAIDDFYQNYSSKRDQGIEEVRAAEEAFIEERDNSVTGTTWDRIVKLVDTSSKGAKSELHDKTRFKEVLLALQGNPNAPGAAGY